MPGAPEKFVNFSAAWSILWGMEDISVSDAALARRAQTGEVEAMAGLVERYRPSLYAVAIGLLHNREDALDAVQETFLIALVKLGLLRDPAAVGGWLHRVLRSTCLMRLRRRGRETPADDVDVPVLMPTPEDVIDHLALRDWVWGAIGTLNPDDRVTLMLRYFSRCQSYQAIASVTGVPVGTVRSRLHRARSQLNSALASTAAGAALAHIDFEQSRRSEWEGFYAELHEAPVPAHLPKHLRIGRRGDRWSWSVARPGGVVGA